MTKQEAIALTLRTASETGECHYALRVDGYWQHSATLQDVGTIFNHVPSQNIIEVRPTGAVIYSTEGM
jgi:hypothetical protein